MLHAGTPEKGYNQLSMLRECARLGRSIGQQDWNKTMVILVAM